VLSSFGGSIWYVLAWINGISNSSMHSSPMNGRNFLVNRCLKRTEWNKLLKTQHIKKILFEFTLIQFFKTCLFVITSFYLFQRHVFFTFLNTSIWWGTCNQAVALRITWHICMPLEIVTTTYLMFIKVFELLWFDKLHIEMVLVWFWRKLW